MSAIAATSERPQLTRVELVAMLTDLGGIDALREQFVADKTYRETPIGALAGRYLDALSFDDYSPKTITNREQTLGWLAFDHPTAEPEAVTYDLLRAFLLRHWSDAATNTKSQHVSSLRNFFSWAYDHDLIPGNPARKLKSPRSHDTERRSHPLETIRKLVVAQPDRRDRVAILLMYWCALRRNELRVVQFRHVDLGRRCLTVFGKGNRIAEQNLPETMSLELERYIQDRDPEPEEFLLFPRKLGRRGHWPAWTEDVIWEDRLRPLSQPGIDKWFQRARDRAGLGGGESKLLMHELRHSAGTHAQEAGHDLLATQAFMRHASAATTERTYIHLDRQREVARVQRQMVDPMSLKD